MTLLSLLKLCFGDVLVDLIFGLTRLYSRREKADISFEITNENYLFSSMLLLSGCHKLSDRKQNVLGGDGLYFSVDKV